MTDARKRIPWLYLTSLSISFLALALSGYVFYFSELRIAEDFKVTIMGFESQATTNGTSTICSDILLMNEGNRTVTITQVALAMSETPTFDLAVEHYWNQDKPLLLARGTTSHKSFCFGHDLVDFMIRGNGTNI